MKLIVSCAILVCLTACCRLQADQQASDILYVTANGRWYAKCIPAAPYGDREKGKTLVYLAGEDEDKLIYTFDWYSPRTLITGWGGGVTIVRFGGRRRGFEARSAGGPHGYEPSANDPAGNLSYEASVNDPAVSFYRNGKMIATHSTLDLVETEDKVSRFDLEHGIIKEQYFVEIFEKKGRDTLSFKPEHGLEVRLRDNTILVFDVCTGKRIPIAESMFTRRVD